MRDQLPEDERALETRRERIVAVFQARITRWQAVQAAALAVGTVGLVAFIGGQLSPVMATVVLIVVALAIVTSAGVQAGLEAMFLLQMGEVEWAFERVKQGRLNL